MAKKKKDKNINISFQLSCVQHFKNDNVYFNNKKKKTF